MSAPVKPILSALRGNAVSPCPVWLMRQAGRYLPEYRALRARAGSFLDLCYSPDLAVEATLQPIRRFGLDAAILFSDILVVPHALGQALRFAEGEGPRLDPIRSPQDLERLSVDGFTGRLSPVYETVQRLSTALPPGTTLIGFSGAPWTLACYMVEGQGSREFAAAKSWAFTDPAGFDALITRLEGAVVEHLSAQITAGAEAVQIFDSWAGVLAEAEFRRFVIAPTERIVRELRRRHPGVPVIGFPRGGGLMLPAYAKETAVDAVSLDTSVPIGWAARNLPCAIQGNLDPLRLLAGGAALHDGVESIRSATADRPAIFNLGHGVLPQTAPEHVAALLSQIRQMGSGRDGAGDGRGTPGDPV